MSNSQNSHIRTPSALSGLAVDEEAAALVPRPGAIVGAPGPMASLNIETPRSAIPAVPYTSHSTGNAFLRTFWDEMWQSTELLFQSKLSWLLLFGPLAVAGDSLGFIGEAACFTCAGLALIPCAERLSFVTEQVAEHTNGTIGALLNATFGNAPELLIATAALRSGFYRVVQLAMLGSILTNLLFVFGMACFVGGTRWQVQEIRIVSGNVSVGMLFLAAAGSLLPAALFLSGQLPTKAFNDDVPSREELVFCRINAAVMVVLYLCYLLFQLGTHKDEFDDERSAGKGTSAQRNLWCQRHVMREQSHQYHVEVPASARRIDRAHLSNANLQGPDGESVSSRSSLSDTDFEGDYGVSETASQQRRRRKNRKVKKSDATRGRVSPLGTPADPIGPEPPSFRQANGRTSISFNSDNNFSNHSHRSKEKGPLLSFRAGLLWLLIITLCISSMSDILVDTLEGFAQRSNMSQVFTSLVVVPYFSNIAEQASAILFAYRNEMDLCLGVTVGSAIQIGAFVMPGSVLIGMMMDRSMTLYFHGYETACYLFAVVIVGSVVQGGSTNWLVGATMIAIYIMMAAGFWVHETEDLSIDAETVIRNVTGIPH